MNEITSETLSDRFCLAAKPAQTMKAQKKRPAPLSVRLNEDERALLVEMAGNKPLGSYVKACLFEGKKPRRARNKNTPQDIDMLARLLAALGQTDAFRNLDILAKAAEDGTLDLSDKTVQSIVSACACITAMRNDLIQALGLKRG